MQQWQYSQLAELGAEYAQLAAAGDGMEVASGRPRSPLQPRRDMARPRPGPVDRQLGRHEDREQAEVLLSVQGGDQQCEPGDRAEPIGAAGDGNMRIGERAP